jgi:hypothetical protein
LTAARIDRSIRICPLTAASSTDQRKTGVESLCWRFKLQGFTWPFVKLAVISGHVQRTSLCLQVPKADTRK